MRGGNLFDDLADAAAEEVVTTLLETGRFKLVRIVSTGQASG